uniref:TNase-like domain-containing protein n=1 Tax=Dictyoglomus thermophilum TaxID=14 RepID=A0A7V3ZJH7_DICTH
MKILKRISILLIFLFLINLFLAISQELPKLIPAKITRVIDGDTIEVILDGKTEKVRFIGVDCPESTTRIEALGIEATQFTTTLLLGKQILIEFDVQKYDSYGRLLAYVWLSQPKGISEQEIRNKMFNAILLLEGYAQVMTVPPNVKYVDYFLKFQKEARESKKGLWGIIVAKEEEKKEIKTSKLTPEEIKKIRTDLDDRREFIRKMYTFSQYGAIYSLATYVEPEGIVIILIGGYGSLLNEDNFNLFFDKLCDAFVTAKYPLETMINVYVAIPDYYSLIVRVPLSAITDYFKEKITRTDFLSKCIILINGMKVNIKEGKIEYPFAETLYIGNINSKIFHYPWCKYAQAMSEKNKVYFSSRENAINSGYRPCEVCKP